MGERPGGKPDPLYGRIDAFIRKTGMLEDTDLVLAGVSGGADSVFLFYLLLALRGKYGYELCVVHLHHGIRGQEADRDAEFVRGLCERYGIPAYIVRRDIPAEAKKYGRTLEEAGRAARYEEFARLAKGHARVKVALAHHRNDAAETLLFHLARGAGVEGLASIRPVRDFYIRPLLAVERDEITDWLIARGISWCEDSTNADNDAARNRIRHTVIPAMETDVNPAAVRHMAASAERCAEASDFIRAEAAARAEKYLSVQTAGGKRIRNAARDAESAPAAEGKVFLCASAAPLSPSVGGDDTENRKAEMTALPEKIAVSSGICGEMKIMQDEILRLALREISGSLTDFHKVHIESLEALFYKENGARLDLPRGLAADRTADGIMIRRKEPREETENDKTEAAFLIPFSDETEQCEGAGGLRRHTAGDDADETERCAGAGALRQHTAGDDADETERYTGLGAVSDSPDVLRQAEISEKNIANLCPGGSARTPVQFGGFSFSGKIFENQGQDIPEKAYTKWFDYDKIKLVPVVIRHRRAGDFLTVNDSGGRKSLSDYLTNEKVPREKRAELTLLVDGSEIIWVVGMRIGYRYRVTEETRRILAVTAVPEGSA